MSYLLASAALPTMALAQTTPADKPTDIGSVNASGVTAGSAGDLTKGPSATGVTRQEIGGGLMVDENVSKAKSSVTRDYIQKQQPSADVFQILKLSPGAVSAASDAYGMNQGQISVRGLDGTQLGFNFEGMPLSVASNWSVFPGQWIDTENTDVVTLNQGSADIGSPNANATGGNVDLFMHTPNKEAGGLIDVSYGTSNAKRVFIRVETGKIKDTGLSAFASVSYLDVDHFRGPGEDKKAIYSVGALQDWGGGSKTKFAMTYSNIHRDTYKNPTLAQFNNGGADGAASNWDSTYTLNDLSYYKLLKNPWENALVSIPSEFRLSNEAKLSVTPYYFYGYGGSGSATTLNEATVGYGNTVNKVDLNKNGTVTDTNVLVYNPILEKNNRAGVTFKLDYQLGNHALVAGVWYQHSRDQLYRPYSTADAVNGTANDVSGQTNLITTSTGQVVNGWYQDTRDDFSSLFFGDSIAMMDDKLKLDLGVKFMKLRRQGFNLVPSNVTYTDADHNTTIPTAALSYKLDEQQQIYTTYAQGYRILPAGALYPRYSAVTGAVTTRQNPTQAPETSTSFEVGYRYQGKLVSLSTSAFHYDFKHRQISAQVCDPACVSSPIDGGKQSATGIDFEAGLHPYHNWRPYVSAEYLKTRIDSDIPVSGDTLATTGKEAVRAPKLSAAIATDYDDGVYFGNLAMKYVGSQYSTFLNDQKIGGYSTLDAAIGMRWRGFGVMKKPELRLNFLNLFDKQYLSGINSPTTNAVATRGANGTLIAASAPSYLVANGFSVMLTFASSF